MKHTLYGLVIVLMLIGICTITFAETVVRDTPNRSSGNKTADALIYTGKASVKQVFIAVDGTNNCSVALYDGTSAAGTIIFPAMPCIGTGTGCTVALNVLASIGIYADMTKAGGDCTYNVHYQAE